MKARYLTDDSGERVGVVLDAQDYRAIMKVYDDVAKGSRAIEEAERSSSESRLEFEAKIAEAQKALAEAAKKLEAVPTGTTLPMRATGGNGEAREDEREEAGLSQDHVGGFEATRYLHPNGDANGEEDDRGRRTEHAGCAPRLAASFRGARDYLETGDEPRTLKEKLVVAAVIAWSLILRR